METLFDKACEYAIKNHAGQKRKDGSIYILHPFEVTSIVSTMTNDVEVLSASILHDVVEECNVSIDEIIKLFGDRVGKLVSLETEMKYPDLSKEASWELRKKDAINRLRETDELGFKIIYLSDKLANIRSLYRDYQKVGYEAFNKFNVNKIDKQAWYYYSVLNSVSELSEYDAYKEYKEKLDLIFKEYRREEIDNGKNSYTL